MFYILKIGDYSKTFTDEEVKQPLILVNILNLQEKNKI